MNRRGTTTSSSAGFTINVRLLIVTLLVLAVGGSMVYLWYRHQIQQNADALYERAEVSKEEGNFSDAARWLSMYLQLRPDDSKAHVQLAEWIDQSAETRAAKLRAIQLYQRALGLFPNRVDLLRRKAELLLEVGRYQEAATEAERLLKAASGDADAKAYYVRAMSLFHQLKPAKAVPANQVVAALIDALTRNPGHTQLSVALGEVYRDFVDPPQPALADRVMDEMITHDPSASARLERYGYRLKYGLPAAADDLEKALHLARENDNDVDALTAVLVAKGQAHLRAKEFTEAIQTFEEVVDKIAPKDYRGFVGLGQAYANQGERTKAIETWQRGINATDDSDVSDLSLYLLVAGELVREVKEKDTEAARKRAEESLSKTRKVLRALASIVAGNQHARIADAIDVLQAECFLAMGMPAKAVPLLKNAASSPRKSPRPEDFENDQTEVARRWSLLGDAYVKLQFWDLAADAFGNTAKRRVNSPRAELAVAAALHKAGRLEPAIEHYRRATEIQDAPAASWVLLARAELQRQSRKKNADEGWRAYYQALKKAESLLGNSVDVILLKAQAAAAQGSREIAANILTEAVQKDPEAVLPLAVVLYETWASPERANECLRQLKQLANGSEANPKAVLVEAQLLVRRDQTKEARQLLQQAAKQAEPDDAAQIYLQLIQIDLNAGKLDDVRRRLRQLYQMQPHNPRHLQRLGDLAIQTRNLDDLAFCEKELRSIEGADAPSSLWRFFRAMRLLLPMSSADGATKPIAGGGDGSSKQDLAEAVALQEYLRRARPTWPATYILKGRIAEQVDRLDEAADAYRRAVDLGSTSIAVFERLVTLLYYNNNWEEISRYLDRLQDSLYVSPLLATLEQNLHLRRGRFVEAVRSAEKAAKRRKDPMSRVWLGYARTLAAENENDPKQRALWYSEAKKAFKEATRGDGRKDFRSWAGLAWYHIRRRQRDDARAALRNLAQHAKLSDVQRNLALAQGYHSIGDLPLAEKHFEKAVQLTPQDMSVRERQARFYLATNARKAEQAYEVLYEMDPNSNRNRRILATILASSGDEAKFQRALGLLKIQPGSGDSSTGSEVTVADRRLQAIVLLQQGGEKNRREALRLLNELVEEGPVPLVSDRLLLAQVYEREGNIDEAQKQFKKVVVDVERPDAAYLEFYLYFLLRNDMLREFPIQLKRLEDLEPNKYSYRTTRLQVRWLSRQNRPEGEILAAVDQYRARGMSEAKTNPEKAAVLLNAARLFDQAGILRQAEEVYRDLANRQLLDSAYQPYAIWLGRKKRFADAIGVCLQAKGTGEDVLLKQAVVLTNVLTLANSQTSEPGSRPIAKNDLRRRQSAEKLVEQALKAHPENRRLLFDVASLRMMQNRREEAKRLYRRLLGKRPDDLVVLNNLALVLSEDKVHQDEALSYIRKALDQAPRSLDLRDSLGVVLLNLGQAQQARQVFSQVLARQADNARFHFHFAAANYILGDIEASRSALSKAKSRAIDDEVLTPSERAMLKRMEVDFKKLAKTPQ